MAAPSYTGLSNYVKGVESDETAINVTSLTQRWVNEKIFSRDKSGGRQGFADDFDPETTVTVNGETNTLTADLVMGVAFGVAETIAGVTAGYGVTGGGYYLDDIEINEAQGEFRNASLNFTMVPGIS